MAGNEGVEVRHTSKCGTYKRKACNCRPNVRAWVMLDGERERRSFNEHGLGTIDDRVNAAATWRREAEKMIRAGTFRVSSETTIKALMESFLSGAEKGVIKTRKGEAYAPSTLHRMRQAAEYRVIPRWGNLDPADLTTDMLERYVEDLSGDDLSASSIQNTIKPLKAMYVWARRTKRVSVNPTIGLLLPTGGRKRERIAEPDEVPALLDALTVADDRVLWAIAFYGGLRRNEVLGLEWSGLDMKDRMIRVRKGYHQETGTVRPIGKTKAARRTVPMPEPLFAELARYGLRSGDRTGYVVGGDTPGMPHWSMFLRRAYKAWEKAKLETLCFHEARHTYASWLIASAVRSGEAVDWKEIAALMGHENVTLTINTYQKLMSDHVERAGARLNRFLREYGT